MIAVFHDRPSRSQAKKPAPAQVIGIPRPRRRRTTRRLVALEIFVSGEIEAAVKQDDGDGEAHEGRNVAPKSLSGLTDVVSQPAMKPTGRSRMIAGILELCRNDLPSHRESDGQRETDEDLRRAHQPGGRPRSSAPRASRSESAYP